MYLTYLSVEGVAKVHALSDVRCEVVGWLAIPLLASGMMVDTNTMSSASASLRSGAQAARRQYPPSYHYWAAIRGRHMRAALTTTDWEREGERREASGVSRT